MNLHTANLLPAAAAVALMPAFAGSPADANIRRSTYESPYRAERSGNAVSTHPTPSEQFSYVLTLGDGWDGDASVAISHEVIARAAHSVAVAQSIAPFDVQPDIQPCADGSLQIEWHLADGQFEMYFEVDGSSSAWWRDTASGHEEEAEGANAQLLLAQWSVRDAAWHSVTLAA